MFQYTTRKGLDKLQKISTSLMAVLVLLTFVGANLHALFWQSSEWLVSTVLPAVVVELTNEEREDNSEVPLQRNTTLDEAARMKAKHMAENEYFSHFSPDGVSPWYWFDQAGYVYAHAGENLAIHFTDSSEVVEAWMKSPTHRQNIVSSLYTEIGVGTYKGEYDGYDTVYVVQLFGAPAIVPEPALVPPVQPEVPTTVQESPLAVAETARVLPEVVEIEVSESLEPAQPAEVAALQDPVPVFVAEEISVVREEFVSEVSPEVVEVPVQVETDTVFVASTPDGEEVVVIETPLIATSSGLAVAQVSNSPQSHAGGTLMSFMTQPSQLLQLVYFALSILIVSMLGVSIVQEARRLHFEQVAYGFLLLVGMGGLWYTHTLLTTGAIIV